VCSRDPQRGIYPANSCRKATEGSELYYTGRIDHMNIRQPSSHAYSYCDAILGEALETEFSTRAHENRAPMTFKHPDDDTCRYDAHCGRVRRPYTPNLEPSSSAGIHAAPTNGRGPHAVPTLAA
jgi:hypothetical protein